MAAAAVAAAEHNAHHVAAELAAAEAYLKRQSSRLNANGHDSQDAKGEGSIRSYVSLDGHKPILPYQLKVKKIIDGNLCQVVVSLIIILNFVVSATKAQIMYQDGILLTDDAAKTGIFDGLELMFAIIFCVELFFNIYGNFIIPFCNSLWNLFDFIIVGVSIAALIADDMPGITVLRLFRAFRVFRLFKRIQSLRLIVIGALKCLPGVSNAFMILALIMGIWSIMAVDFFGGEDQDEEMLDMFGYFSRSMLTMFQISTFDSWSSGITRPLVLEESEPIMALAIALFFVSFLFITAIILMNVVVAILLDKFLSASDELTQQDLVDDAPDIPKVKELLSPDSVRDRVLVQIKELKGLMEMIQKGAEEQEEEVKKEMRMERAMIKAERRQWAKERHQLKAERNKMKELLERAGMLAELDSGGIVLNEREWVRGSVLNDTMFPLDNEPPADFDLPTRVAVNKIQRWFREWQRCRREGLDAKGVTDNGVPDKNAARPTSNTCSADHPSKEEKIALLCETEGTGSYALWDIDALKRGESSFRLPPGARKCCDFVSKFISTVFARRQFKLPGQDRCKEFYNGRPVQVSVALLIFLNFFVSAIKAEIRPPDTESLITLLSEGGGDAELAFGILEVFFIVIFTIELFVNFYSNFWLDFWLNAWNVFDVVVVNVSIVSVLLPNVPGIAVLRLFRAFRAFRLFKRVKSLRMIVAGVLKALPGVSNAFIILGMIMGIWSILGVEFFGKEFPEFYGNFGLAMLSMFQVMTFDGWASQIARPVILSKGVMAAIFFVTYTFSASVLMMNVVIAILVDKFLAAAHDPEEAENKDGSTEDSTPVEERSLEQYFGEMESAVMDALLDLRSVIQLHKDRTIDQQFVKEFKQCDWLWQRVVALDSMSVVGTMGRNVGTPVRVSADGNGDGGHWLRRHSD